MDHLSVRQAVKASLQLLSQRDRRILILVTIAQMATSFLDLVGILLIGVVAALSISVVAGGAPPATVETVVGWLGLGNVSTITAAGVLAVSAAFLLILKSALTVVLTRRVLKFLAIRQARVSGRLASSLLSRPLLQVQQRSSQETAFALTTGVNQATIMILGQTVVALTEVALLAILAVGLFLLDPIVTIFTIVYFALVALLLQRIISSWASRLGKFGADAEIASIASVQEALTTYREVTVSNRRPLYVQRFQALRWDAASVQSDLQFMGLVPKYVFEVALVIGAGLLAGSQLIFKDAYGAIATIAIFLAAGSRIVPSMLRLQGASLSVRGAAGVAGATFDLAAELRETDSGLSERQEERIDLVIVKDRLNSTFEDFDASVSVDGVTLRFSGSELPALANVSVHAGPGSSLALVGPTGAGKSTLADVILGVLKPDAGRVTIGGLTPIEAVTRWPGAIAYVPQEVAMVNGSIRENVALGLPVEIIDDSRVWEALNRANLGEFLEQNRDGLDTLIGEGGMKLSGGQRQRLGVARALYTRPKLLVLDEATSALDAETEDAIVKTFQSLEGEVTTITIAHRLATIRHSDQIAYLETGHVITCGTFDEVRRAVTNFDRQAQLLGL
jgi:ABC-type multidrug transport system fused ATPase/permease subunit